MARNWRLLLTDEVRRFVLGHEDDDLATLALAPSPFASELRMLVLDQIKARQKARKKLPGWHRVPGIVFPRSALVEQASSEATGAYKSCLAQGGRFIDLTAGVGVDAAAWAGKCLGGTCIEPDAEAAELLRHNLPLLSPAPVEVVQARAEDQVDGMGRVDLAYLDPQRRDDGGRRSFLFEDSRPDPTALIPRLVGKAERIVLKASPMLDLKRAASALGGVLEVHVVEWRGECREALYVIAPGAASDQATRRIHGVAIDDAGVARARFIFTDDEERLAQAPLSRPRRFIIEPGPALMKAGAFALIAARFSLGKLHPSTHLYTCDEPAQLPRAFPGSVFELRCVLRVDAQEFAAAAPGRHARLRIRNFPGSRADLVRQLGLIEGGEETLFACTLADGAVALLLTRPYDQPPA